MAELKKYLLENGEVIETLTSATVYTLDGRTVVTKNIGVSVLGVYDANYPKCKNCSYNEGCGDYGYGRILCNIIDTNNLIQEL